MNITASLVKQLVEAQFPQWADLDIRPVENGGHDNRTFHLGDRMSVRLPSAEPYARHVGIEHRWLPKLAPQLPLSIPEPIGLGRAALGYPWPWTVNKWIRGEPASLERIENVTQFAADLAAFLNALQRIDASGGPSPGAENFHRGGPLLVYDSETRESIAALEKAFDPAALDAIWEAALDAKWDRPAVWVHGDIAPGNLLVSEGRLCAVIDFGQLATGDPSCDLAIAWTLFSGASRRTFREAMNVDQATWIRARGWALWKALITAARKTGSNPREAATAKDVIAEILDDDEGAV